MPDLRDLICTAERLEAHGFTRRAAAAWRKVVTHPATPDALREKIWSCADAGAVSAAGARGKTGRKRKGTTEQMHQIAAMFAQGVNREEVAEKFGVSTATVTRAYQALCPHIQRKRGSRTHA